MASILNGNFVRDDMTSKAMGGTELLAHRLIEVVSPEFLEDTQIHFSRVTQEQDKSKKQILYLHDLAEDPAVQHLHQTANVWEKIVFVSHWQRQQYHNEFSNLSYEKTFVIPNAIRPLTMTSRKEGPIKLIYTSTPHRGLDILYATFEALSNQFDIELDVYSSFALYGWTERDKAFQPLFDKLSDHPKITHHFSKPNDVVRAALQNADIFAYPSTWTETSCLCLIEAMSAGLTCVHSSLGALAETSKSVTWQYDYCKSPSDHVNRFYAKMYSVLSLYQQGREHMRGNGMFQKQLTDSVHNMTNFKYNWEKLLYRG